MDLFSFDDIPPPLKTIVYLLLDLFLTCKILQFILIDADLAAVQLNVGCDFAFEVVFKPLVVD